MCGTKTKLLLVAANATEPPLSEGEQSKGTRFLLRDGEDTNYGLPKDYFSATVPFFRASNHSDDQHSSKSFFWSQL